MSEADAGAMFVLGCIAGIFLHAAIASYMERRKDG